MSFLNPLGLNPKRLDRAIRGNRKRFRLKFNRKQWAKGTMVVLLALLLGFAAVSADLPTPNRIKRRTNIASTQILDRQGKLLFAFAGEQKRLPVGSSEIPDYAKKAIIAIEDKDFYSHPGIRFTSIARAALNNIFRRSGSLQGGSTITQQYVKNALLSPRRSIVRKVKEAIMAVELEILYSKDDILGFYLNEIPYGSNIYGIEAASRTYFAKPASQLTLAQSAVLAAMPQRPTYYSPWGNNLDKLLARKDLVLERMVHQGYISQDDLNQAKTEKITFEPRDNAIIAPHFVFFIREQLADKYGERLLDTGLKVTTTLDLEVQKQAEQAVKEGAKKLDRYGANNAALVALDPKTGAIVAMVGSRDYFNDDIQGQVNVTTSARQPGSSFKPVVYASAFKKAEFNPARVLFDLKTDFGGGYSPDNYNGQTNGPITMRQALANSLNIPAVKTLSLVGLKDALKTARDLGITTLTQPDRYGLSLVLGGGEVTPLEMASAFGVFANEGKRNPAKAILKVETLSGQVLEETDSNPPELQVLDPQLAYQISHVLSDNEARGLIFGTRNFLTLPGQLAAAKTGTTQEFRDAWTIGYTKYISVAVWAGNTDNTKMKAGADGSVVAAPIWQDFMKRFHQNKTLEQFPRPAGIQEITVDKFSNKLPSPDSPELITDIFTSWQVPTDQDNVHLRVKINKITGKLATNQTPPELVEEKLFAALHSERPGNPAWEEPVRRWALERGLISDPPKENDDQYAGAQMLPTVELTAPAAGASLNAPFTISAKVQSPFGIKRVEFYIDNVLIASDDTEPYETVYDPTALTQGEHSLRADVFDTNGAKTATTINFNFAQQALVITNIQTSTSPTTATINWLTNRAADSQVEYGQTAGTYNGKSVLDRSALTSHSLILGGLAPGTNYHFRVLSRDSTGTLASSANQSFTTKPL